MTDDLMKAFSALMPDESDPEFFRQKALDTAKSALQMIAGGCSNPQGIAKAALGDIELTNMLTAASEEKKKS